MTAGDPPARGNGVDADDFSAPTYHYAQQEPPHHAQQNPATAAPPAGATARVRPQGTGSLTVTRAVVARSRYISKLIAHKVITASEADGARESGLTAMIWNQVMSYGADAMITVALAGTVFFSASSDAQRGNVLLYLLMTMAPFAVVAPVIGPVLDRLQHGRRWAMAGTAIGRALLAAVMAMNFTDLLVLFPAALGSLVLSKAYAVIRASAAPRLVPRQLTLVETNARLSMFGVVAAVVTGGFVALVIKVTGSYPAGLWITALAFAATAVDAFRLPKIIDAPPPRRAEVPRGHPDHAPFGEGAAASGPQPRPGAGHVPPATGPARSRSRAFGLRVLDWAKRGFDPAALLALQGGAALRWLQGFLTIFLAFYVESTSHGWQALVNLGGVAVAAGLGNFVGTAIGTRLKLNRPDVVVVICAAAATAGCVFTAVLFSIGIAIFAMLVASVANSLGKLALDAIIQREVAEPLRSSAFGRSESFLQLAWVFGATVALLVPSKSGHLGFIVAACVTAVAMALILLRRRAVAADDATRGADGLATGHEARR